MVVCTIEKANNIINHLIKTKSIRKYRTVVVDEAHMIGDRARGYLLELLINKLLFLQAAEGLDLQLICLSATLPNIGDIVRYTNSACFVATQRPNRLSEYLIVAACLSVKSSATTKSSARPITFLAVTKRSVGLISCWNPCAPLYRCASLLWTCAIAKPTRTSW